MKNTPVDFSKNTLSQDAEEILSTMLEDEGWLAYHAGTAYGELTTDEERAGWKDAYGSNMYLLECLREGIPMADAFEQLPV